MIDPEDRSLVEENIFSPSELKEIYTYNQKSLPNLPQDLLEYLGSYQLACIFHIIMLQPLFANGILTTSLFE